MSGLNTFRQEITQFEHRYDPSREREALRVRGEFLKVFPLARIPKLTLRDYVIGGRTPGFCTYVEAKTRAWANVQGANSFKFGVYFGRTRSDPHKQYRFARQFGATAPEAFRRVKKALVVLIDAGQRMDFEGIDRNNLSQMFKAKILSLYFPERYLNICSDDHLALIARKLGLEKQKHCSSYQHRLLEAKRAHALTRGWSNPKFMTFLYETFVPGHLRDSGGRGAIAAAAPSLIQKLAKELNAKAKTFEIGRLQTLRAQMHARARVSSAGIFGAQSIQPTYAFHLGGRTELQFNIGEEVLNGQPRVRHCVAFSLETNPTLPTIQPLLPKIDRFNQYIQTHRSDLDHLVMWYWDKRGRSTDLPVGPIPDEWRVRGNFIAVGRHTTPDEVDARVILQDFDRLLPLYAFIESADQAKPPPETSSSTACPDFAESANAVLSAKVIVMDLRHKRLQKILHRCLEKEGGQVRTECPVGLGGKVDARVTNGPLRTFYELKIASTAQECVRQAVGQLLEYAYWPNVIRASELIVVGEAEISLDAKAFLDTLRNRFKLPIWYRQIDERQKTLSERF